MSVTHHTCQFDYRVAEEVVVQLANVAALDPRSGREIASRRLPAWTIAEITAHIDGDGPRYAIRFRHAGTAWIAAVPAEAIDGTA